jgi:hypothetical protein
MKRSYTPAIRQITEATILGYSDDIAGGKYSLDSQEIGVIATGYDPDQAVYTECDRCGRAYPKKDMTETRRNKYRCSDCVDSDPKEM